MKRQEAVQETRTAQIKELRARTGAGVVDCRNALIETDGDLERAVEYLRKRGLATAEKKAGRVASEGLIESYIHTGGKVGALIEVNCETDFVARTDEFRRLARDLAMQVTASVPLYTAKADVPSEVVEAQRRLFSTELAGKPSAAIEGRLEKWFQEVVLLEQAFIKDEAKRVRDVITEVIAKVGENVQVRRFARFKLGD